MDQLEYHLFLVCSIPSHEGRWGATDNFATSFLQFFLFSTALWDLANSRHIMKFINVQWESDTHQNYQSELWLASFGPVKS